MIEKKNKMLESKSLEYDAIKALKLMHKEIENTNRTLLEKLKKPIYACINCSPKFYYSFNAYCHDPVIKTARMPITKTRLYRGI